ncbi:DUF4235 domain-containing protein [Salinisphaera sp. Q1T1-3]|uniref:DUF4235 domain-containing protein n=1 Tax=Salinisphaera sp. Q1T1-3 TaxID=2321229 RepID=UPI000E7667EE|nr:DUF4235 domain-containing protein [Salinisphaera sp. Q1T1-3]RJS91434.1 DUF4235 domain-containing protein [Salinisphaera sp. Q1T1-3]
MKRHDPEHLAWMALSAGAAIGAGMLARKSTTAAWRYVRDEEPPQDSADPRQHWYEILIWAALSGVCVAAARLAGRSLASRIWRRRLGRTPPSA